MNIRDILLFILVIAFLYIIKEINTLKQKEKFTTATTEDQITAAVKRIYLADVEAIRLLSNFAIQLSQGGTTVPGNVTFSNKVNVKGEHSIGGDLILDGDYKWIFKKIYNGNLRIAPWNGRDDWNWNNSIEIDINGGITLPAGNIISCEGIQHLYGTEKLYLLHKNGVIIAKNWGGNGNLEVQGNAGIVGNLTVNGNGMYFFCMDVGDATDKPIEHNNYSFNASNWVCIVGGINVDFNNNSSTYMRSFTYVKDNVWNIRTEIEGARDVSRVPILAIPVGYFAVIDTNTCNRGDIYI